ncbi:hypothetical protein FNV43_RR08741 [Rhamnella rubrinervis]|uniref:Uncharacterized protein n=1 Tax=Rhamnella rubrinervis TaxID=2594499 RepID=A0A8K0H9Y2_9ROSA|nr:hypothetical protein FNV43_RR08741 [Rhamnella rubrinervis]
MLKTKEQGAGTLAPTWEGPYKDTRLLARSRFSLGTRTGRGRPTSLTYSVGCQGEPQHQLRRVPIATMVTVSRDHQDHLILTRRSTSTQPKGFAGRTSTANGTIGNHADSIAFLHFKSIRRPPQRS